MSSFIQPINKAIAQCILKSCGIKNGMTTLANTGSVYINASVRITWCRNRYHLIDLGSIGGENLVDLLPREYRQNIPSAGEDKDGTYEQRKQDQNEALKTARLKEIFSTRRSPAVLPDCKVSALAAP